ncbi:PIG-L family deacetylase [Serinibacter salmoneus]|nr:PIG-L family deacetylase [Serinibacter salmoneus]
MTTQHPDHGRTAEGGVLAVYAHPDDETLTAGGLLALAAAQGRRVAVVTATRGERGEMIGTPDLEGTDGVAPAREAELVQALEMLGVTERYWLDDLPGAAAVTDSGMSWVRPGLAGPAPDAGPDALTAVDPEVQAAALARLIRQMRPALVVCDEPGGSYGHPDHVRTHLITVRAVALARTAGPGTAGEELEGVDAVLAWVVVAESRMRAARAEVTLAAADLHATDWRGESLQPPPAELPALVVADDAVSVEWDTSGVVPFQAAALRCYTSQVQSVAVPVVDGGGRPSALSPHQSAVGWYALSNGVVAPLLPTVALVAHRDAAALRDLALGVPVTATPAAGTRSTAQADAAGTAHPATPGLLARVAQPLLGLGWFLLGTGLGTIGTLVHRARVEGIPYGIVLAFALVLSGALLARAVSRWTGLVGFALGLVVIVQVLALATTSSAGVLIGDTYGNAWLVVSVLAVGVAAFVPERVLRESPAAGGER